MVRIYKTRVAETMDLTDSHLSGVVNPDKEVEHFEFRLGRIYQIREDVFLHCHTFHSQPALTRSLAPHNSNWMMICC